MKKLLLAIFIAGIFTTTFGQFTTLWERNSRTGAADVKPSWMTTAGAERGIAYGNMGNGERLYVASRSGGNSIRVINPTTGADVTLDTPFNLSSVSGGTFAINDIELSSDNVLFLGNLASSAFKLYVWTTEGGAPSGTYTFTLPTVSGIRYGDKFYVIGSWAAGTVEVYVPGAGTATDGKVQVLKTTNQGTDWTTTEITLTGSYKNTVSGQHVAVFGDDKAFYTSGNGANPRKHGSDGAYVASSLFSGTNSSQAANKVFKISSRNYLLLAAYRAPGTGSGNKNTRGLVYEVTTPSTPVLYGTTELLSNNSTDVANAVAGDVTVKSNSDGTYTIFILGTDQGLGAYTTNTGSIGWGNVQFPTTASITTLESVTVYGQVYVDGVTNPAGQGAGIGAWLGYSATNTNPNTWTNWIPATFNTQSGNNDEYQATLSSLSAGTYYYAYRYQNQLGQYYYGGTGGAWDNSSGVLTVSAPPTTFDFVNLQYPGSGSITTIQSFDVYAQDYIAGVTNPAGAAAGVSCWIGYHTEDTDPSTWTNWVAASFSSQQGDNDEYKGTLSGLAAGTYYYASRFQRNSGDYYYGGYSTNGGGTWDGTANVSGTLTVSVPPTTINWANLASPASGSINTLESIDVYGQVYVDGETNGAGQAAGITCWVGYSFVNSSPENWTNWEEASYTGDVGNNDNYKATLSGIPAGTYYYMTRWQRAGGDYYYGGYSAGGGGFWDGVTYVSGTLTVTEAPTNIDFINLQYPGSGSITAASSYDVYAQIYIAGVTPPAGQAAGITCWIGYNTDNNNPVSENWTWVEASYFGSAGINNNNDEYKATLTLGKGTYYYASRFQRNGGDYYYGGYSTDGGGTWNGTTNISGTLNVSGLTGTYYIGAAGTKPGGGNPDFATLKAACDNLNTNVVDANVTYLITSDLTEAQDVWLGANTGSFTITFKPYTGLTPTINFTQTTLHALTATTGIDGHFVIGSPTGTSDNMVKTDRIVIDGSNVNDGSTKNLTINGAATTSQKSVIRIFGDNDNNVIKNCIISTASSTGNSNAAIHLTLRFASSLNYQPDNITIQNNTLTATSGNGAMGVYVLNSDAPTIGLSNLVIRDNNISARLRGIYVSYTINADIFGNRIEVNSQATQAAGGIVLTTNFAAVGTFNVYNNTITRLRSLTATAGASNGIIGIDNQNLSPKVVNIHNNFISGFESSTSTTNAKFYGIRAAHSSTSNIYYNTIYIPEMTNFSAFGSSYIAGIAFATAATTEASPLGTVNFKNNLIVSDETTMKVWNIRRVGTSGTFTSDYNDLYYNSSNAAGFTGYFNASDYQSFSDWKTNSSQDANSISADPLFHNPSNLHVIPVSPVASAGTPVEGYTTDYDGQARNATNPSIGADEVTQLNQLASGTAANPSASTENPVIPIESAGGMTFNPTDQLTGNVRGYFFPIGRSGSAPAGVTNIPDYFWSVSTNIASFTGTARFYFSQIPNSGVNSPSTLKLLKRDYDGAEWVEYTDVTRENEYIQANNLTGFSDFTFGGGVDNPLPVELVRFSAKSSGNKVVLNWATATEVDNYGFEIQRTEIREQGSEKIWNKVGFVPGNGNSNSEKSYSFTDRNIQSATKYIYRLKQVDTDGSFDYSKEVEVTTGVPDKYELSQNHPNPFNPSTSISYSLPVESRVTLVIYSMSGEKVAELVNEVQPAGSYSVPFDASRLSSGTYLYRITANDFIQTRKMLLIK
ncbi:MAG: T9SS type A sorting domain-containing protein [Ignavibacteriaceae bacterium]|nr:T9SS type A sorting domain-containing protein [Ignavibacteriaceae bacterium]